jgi:uncharacterized protein YggT (Ycf19 family)
MPSQNSNSQNQNVNIPEGLQISKVILYIAYFWVYLGIFTLVIRTFLLATSANLGTGFSSFIMRTSGDYLRPFRGIFPPAQVGETGYLDISAIFAVIIYLFVAWGIKAFIDYVNNKIQVSIQKQQQASLQDQLDESDLKITATRKKKN